MAAAKNITLTFFVSNSAWIETVCTIVDREHRSLPT